MSPKIRAFIGFAVLVWALVAFVVGCTYITVNTRDVDVRCEVDAK